MGNFVKNQEVIQRNLDEIIQSQVQESPNILIKQSKIGNVEIIKLNMQIIEVELIYDSVDKIQVDLTYSSQVNCSLSFYTYITEIKGSKSQRFERTMQESIIQKFKCPQGLNHQFPSRFVEFMITDLLKFNRIKATPEVSHHTLIIEMKSLTSKSFQIIYFYRIDCNEQTFRCELINTKQIIVYKNRMYEIHELYGVKNTPFNPEWNPNTIEDKECVICFCNIINTVLLPCKHMCTCSICADHILMSQKQNNVHCAELTLIIIQHQKLKIKQSKIYNYDNFKKSNRNIQKLLRRKRTSKLQNKVQQWNNQNLRFIKIKCKNQNCLMTSMIFKEIIKLLKVFIIMKSAIQMKKIQVIVITIKIKIRFMIKSSNLVRKITQRLCNLVRMINSAIHQIKE